jgi:hypothetical protein
VTDQELETLVVVAAMQPVTTKDINAIRKTESAEVLQALRKRKLIIQRAKPYPPKCLWKTSQLFLDMFDLDNVEELRKVMRSSIGGEQWGSDEEFTLTRSATSTWLRQLGTRNRVARAAARKRCSTGSVCGTLAGGRGGIVVDVPIFA